MQLKIYTNLFSLTHRMDISDLNSDLVGEIKVVATNENGSDERKVRKN